MAFVTAIAMGFKAERDLSYAVDLAHRADQVPPDRFGANLAWCVAAAMLAAGGIRVLSALSKAKSQVKKDLPADLYGCCMMLHHQFDSACGDGTPGSLRVTLYRVSSRRDKKAEELERVVPYAVSAGVERGQAGEIVSGKAGVIGKASRSGEVAVCCRSGGNQEEFRDQMVKDYGFSKEEARNLNETRWSWLAIPIRDAQSRVDGVLYLDSSKKDCFSEETCGRIILACGPLCAFIDWRYGNGE